jgi:hypothetical protein
VPGGLSNAAAAVPAACAGTAAVTSGLTGEDGTVVAVTGGVSGVGVGRRRLARIWLRRGFGRLLVWRLLVASFWIPH